MKTKGLKATKIDPVTVTVSDQRSLTWLHKAARLTGKPVEQEARKHIRVGACEIISLHKKSEPKEEARVGDGESQPQLVRMLNLDEIFCVSAAAREQGFESIGAFCRKAILDRVNCGTVNTIPVGLDTDMVTAMSAILEVTTGDSVAEWLEQRMDEILSSELKPLAFVNALDTPHQAEAAKTIKAAMAAYATAKMEGGQAA